MNRTSRDLTATPPSALLAAFPRAMPPQHELAAVTTSVLPGWAAAVPDETSVTPITKGGSDRNYFRLVHPGADPASVIIMVYTERRPDNAAFVPATRLLARHGVRVPALLAAEVPRRTLWLEDVGEADLWSHRHDPWPERRDLYTAALDEVAHIHAIRPDSLDPPDREFLQPSFDARLYRWEQEYFLGQCVSRLAGEGAAARLREVGGAWLESIAVRLDRLPRRLVHRDFQSQNILFHGGQAVLIDYQGLRAGRPEYDLASLLYDPYVHLEPGERSELVAAYRARATADVPVHDDEAFLRTFLDCSVQRLLQALGAYGYLGMVLGKRPFLAHVDPALANLREVLAAHPDRDEAARLADALSDIELTQP